MQTPHFCGFWWEIAFNFHPWKSISLSENCREPHLDHQEKHLRLLAINLQVAQKSRVTWLVTYTNPYTRISFPNCPNPRKTPSGKEEWRTQRIWANAPVAPRAAMLWCHTHSICAKPENDVLSLSSKCFLSFKSSNWFKKCLNDWGTVITILSVTVPMSLIPTSHPSLLYSHPPQRPHCPSPINPDVWTNFSMCCLWPLAVPLLCVFNSHWWEIFLNLSLSYSLTSLIMVS